MGGAEGGTVVQKHLLGVLWLRCLPLRHCLCLLGSLSRRGVPGLLGKHKGRKAQLQHTMGGGVGCVGVDRG